MTTYYTRFRYHFITTTKHRTAFLQPSIEKFVYNAICRRVDDLGAKVIALDGVADHFHLIVAIPPAIAPADFMREIKTASTRSVRKVFPELQLFEWQRGYGGFTLNPDDMEAVI